jgi:hypothetical protein
MDRRQFAGHAALAAGWAMARAARGSLLAKLPQQDASRHLVSDDPGLMQTWNAALDALQSNVVRLADFPGPVLAEGRNYPGLWLECAPHEGLIFREFGPSSAHEVARNNHLLFFALQREDGQIPYAVKARTPTQAGGPGWGQIQMVVPIAATAWELARRTGDSELLVRAYTACSRWDAWLRRYRNTRGTGLCEGFCTFDTGMDNSPRWKDEPNTCPDGDARKCPPGWGLPRLCPDLSATVYGSRVALAAMARALGKTSEANQWDQDAEGIRQRIVNQLYYAEDAGFYDLDAQGRFVWVRSVALLRVLGEHVPDAKMFSTIWQRQVHNPKVFWAPYPFPSLALDDPGFVRPIPANSWGGAAQALTALRAPRWMEHYGKPAELALLMSQWVSALRRAGEFHQQLDPLNGEFTPDVGGYSPAALVLLDFLWRLSGVHPHSDSVEWNVRPPAKGNSTFTASLHGITAELAYCGDQAALCIGGKSVATVNGIVRLITAKDGALREAVGIAQGESQVKLRSADHERIFKIQGNARISLA